MGRTEYRRKAVPFRSVNRQGEAGYMSGVQRHHLLPRVILKQRWFGRMLDTIGRRRIGFDDFRQNGLLLPANESTARRTGMPLHRGPHRDYNAMVIDRVGNIESQWSRDELADAERALEEAMFRLRLLQAALRRRLLDENRRFVLNRKDPLGTGFDFSELDAMAETLWQSTSCSRP